MRILSGASQSCPPLHWCPTLLVPIICAHHCIGAHHCIRAHHWCPPMHWCPPLLEPTIGAQHYWCPPLVPTIIGALHCIRAHHYWSPLLVSTIDAHHHWCPPGQNVQNAIVVNGTLQMANGTDAQNALAIGMPQELSNAFCF